MYKLNVTKDRSIREWKESLKVSNWYNVKRDEWDKEYAKIIQVNNTNLKN